METRWMKAWALSITLAVGTGCGSDPKPGSDEPDMLVAGTGGGPVAGDEGGHASVSGGGGQGGAAGESSVQFCDPLKEADAGWVALDVHAMDSGVVLPEPDEDAGVDGPAPTPTNQDPPQDPPIDAGTMDPDRVHSPQNSGDLVFTELMPDPTLLSDALGEWIEIHNSTEQALALTGCVLSDDSRDHYVFAELHVAANGYAVLGRSSMAAEQVDVVYDGVALTNTEDELVLTCDDVVIDRIAYGAGFPRTAGRTMQLDPNALNASDNDVAQNWCIGMGGGTPGHFNAACPAR